MGNCSIRVQYRLTTTWQLRAAEPQHLLCVLANSCGVIPCQLQAECHYKYSVYVHTSVK